MSLIFVFSALIFNFEIIVDQVTNIKFILSNASDILYEETYFTRYYTVNIRNIVVLLANVTNTKK